MLINKSNLRTKVAKKERKKEKKVREHLKTWSRWKYDGMSKEIAIEKQKLSDTSSWMFLEPNEIYWRTMWRAEWLKEGQNSAFIHN